MASATQNWDEDPADQEPAFELKPGHRLPGWTVDALLDQGNVDEARSELERLLVDGASSPASDEPFEDFLDRLRERGRQAAARRQ